MTNQAPPDGELVPVASQQTLQLFAQMAAGIPEADDSEAYESILTQVLTADTVDQLNAPWETTPVERLNGHQVRIDDLTRRPSDYKQGLGLFLVAKGVDQTTGERAVITTGSIAVVATITRAYYIAGLPITVRWVVGDKNPRTGNQPQHVEIVALAGTPRTAATEPVHDGQAAGDPAPF